MKSNRMLNGYVVVHRPNHPSSMRGGNWDGYIYEHILVGEEVIDRQIKEGEEVHHLDTNRSNNSPDNLLVLSGPMHKKLHSWLEKYTLIPNEKQVKRIERGCIRCKFCDKPINHDLIYCSHSCSDNDISVTHKYLHPDKESLEKLIWSKPTTLIAKDLNVSDVAISKLCKKLNVEKPPRGYWTRVNAGLICILK